jgi:predicted TIM-barrel fold metal-dependent hydrolase
MDFFDCNCMVGRWGQPLPGQFHSAADLERELGRCGIARALVFHALAKELDPATGNSALARELSGRERLSPCWILMPHHTGEMPAPAQLCDRMAQQGVKAARLFPQAHSYSLGEWCCGELLSALEQRGIPVFLDHDQTNWSEVDALCAAHPGLPLTLLRVNYRAHRSLYPLFERHPNLHVEIGLFVAHNGIVDCARRYGARRLLFGSALPHFTPGGPIANIMYADVSDADKALIAGGNLRRLLGDAQ